MRAKEITFLGESTDDLIENKIVNCNQVKRVFVTFMTRIEEISEEELVLERNIIRLRLIRIEEELTKRAERRTDTGLRDKNGSKISIGNKVKLLTASTKSSPFAGQEHARVIGTGHNGKRVRLGLLSDQSITTDRIPTNVEIVREI